jgi:hypothetical protein
MSEGKKAFVLGTAAAQVIPFFEEGRELEKVGKVKEECDLAFKEMMGL